MMRVRSRSANENYGWGVGVLLLLGGLIGCTSSPSTDSGWPGVGNDLQHVDCSPVQSGAQRLATVTYVADVHVEGAKALRDFSGVVSALVTVEQVAWSADGYWSLGEYKAHVAPTEGSVHPLVANEAWDLSVGDRIRIAVTTMEIAIPDMDGQIQHAIDDTGESLRRRNQMPDGLLGRVMQQTPGEQECTGWVD